jgi:cobalamin 5'-phosphate synthase/cobalamin synthase
MDYGSLGIVIESGRSFDRLKSFFAAIAFLTRIPVGWVAAFESADVGRAAGWFPLVGLLLGAIYAGVAYLLRGHLPALVVGVLLVALDAVITGALHYDGLADSADGFGGGKTRDDVLRIMRDHAIGSYGGMAIVLAVALKVAAFTSLLSHQDWAAAMVLTPAVGRWSVLLLTAALPYARASASVAEGMRSRLSLIGGTVTIVVAVAASISIDALRPAIAAAVVSGLLSAAFGFYCKRRIGGITGDTLGANVELCECATLLAFLWSI